MTLNETQNEIQENKPSDKELNFRALEAKYERQLELERTARIEAEKVAQEFVQKQQQPSDEEDDDHDSFVEYKKLNKKLERFGEQTKKQTQSEIQKAVTKAIYEERKQSWLKSNPDFFDVMQNAEKLMIRDPELAETILEMPEGFERQKLVYKNIKALGLHKPEVKQPTIQDKIDANRRSPYYQPTGIGTSPYATSGDFSESGKKQAYEKMQELKNKLRI